MYIMRHGIITNRHGHVIAQMTMAMAHTLEPIVINRKRKRGKTMSIDSQSLTSLLIMRPCGVVSKNESFVRTTALNVSLKSFLAAVITNM